MGKSFFYESKILCFFLPNGLEKTLPGGDVPLPSEHVGLGEMWLQVEESN